jgi:hypothetical protein
MNGAELYAQAAYLHEKENTLPRKQVASNSSSKLQTLSMIGL